MRQRWVPESPRDELVMETMKSVRAFSDAMDHMHGGLRGDMDMNATDLAALRMLIMREQRGEWVSPHAIATHLAISTASTTKLLDRLTASGHLERRPHPSDRRARVVVLSELARADFYRHFGERMLRMRQAMTGYSDDELRAVVRFLADMEVALSGEG
ncbi:MarR family winged helix-turn-helix transcriptional regulator [Microbacterium invictum]|uniref:DNA-binding MarR family transcriptional regulator n=1 Tax=Microbacterium invictum TaxID=515415 RepID=A0AA40VKU3_9MICO|nr:MULTISPECIES: MarR family transcriptional regulator [Microbacterium]MBB4138796.1 DNA-binding MarR family transcriptional regulator [Microbacterium invictum]